MKPLSTGSLAALTNLFGGKEAASKRDAEVPDSKSRLLYGSLVVPLESEE